MTQNLSVQARLVLLAFALCVAAPAQAQITFRAAGVQTAGTGTSITPGIPAGTQAGDLAVLIIAGRPTNTTQPAAPVGWTRRSSRQREVGSNDLKIMTFYRVLTGGEANPTVRLPTAWQGTAAGMSGQISVWRGVSTTSPFDVADVTGNAAAVTTWTPPTITTVTPGAWVVSAVATSDNNALAIGTARGFTGRMTGASKDTTTGSDHAVGLADKLQATPGTATLLTWRQSVNASDRWAGITFALRPIPANTPPTVALTSPAGGATFTAPATIALAANAADTDGTITKVEFFHGGTNLIATVTAAPYTFNWTNVAAAGYALTARATDNLGAVTTSAPVTITVNAANAANAAPTVALTSPANGASFTAPANITVAAEASDADGTITQVEFYNGASLIATRTMAPYNIVWTGVPQGAYTLTARVTDNQGATVTSAAVAVAVTANAAVAQMHYIHPDHLNTPRVITNQAQQVVWRWDNNDPFGGNPPDENPSGLGTFTCNLRLPGQYFDRETNTHYNYFRDYDPAIGRYIQSDPIGLDGGINLYTYVGNNPLIYVDPTGLFLTTTLNELTRGEYRIPREDAIRISNFSSAVGVTGAAAAAFGPPLVVGAGEAGALMCRVAAPVIKRIPEACKNPILAAALGASICTSDTAGRPPGSARQFPRDRETIDKIRDAVQQERRNTGGVPRPW